MEPNIKGYAIEAATQFILEDPELSGRVPAALVEDFRREAASIKPTQWYPRTLVIARYAAVAQAAGSEAAAYAALVRCGRANAGVAIKGYLKLVLKMLTPRMFATKFPDFWARDQQSGHAEVSILEERRLVICLRDVGGFDHIGPGSAGFMSFAMESIGLHHVEVKCSPWSLAQPGPADVSLEARWK